MTHPTPLPAVDADVAALTFLAEHIEHANSELVAISSGAAPCIRRILTALTAAQARAEAVEWQPLATAPKDGTEIILRRGPRVGAGMWCKWPATEHEEAGEGWTIGFDGDSWDEDKAPTHWRPLPPPPATDSAIGGKGA